MLFISQLESIKQERPSKYGVMYRRIAPITFKTVPEENASFINPAYFSRSRRGERGSSLYQCAHPELCQGRYMGGGRARAGRDHRGHLGAIACG